MGDNLDTCPDRRATSESVTDHLRALAFQAWAARRPDDQDCSIALFERTYLGHYSHIDDYVSRLVDGYQLDARLDAAVSEPYRSFVDIDITALAQSFVQRGTLYAVQAVPVGVWVFNGEAG